jgi:CheY-like chemotaxis protein
MSMHHKMNLQLQADNLKLAELNQELLVRSEAMQEALDAKEAQCQRLATLCTERTGARDLAVEQSDALHRFLATMSYQIRTPMTGILGMIDFTLASELKPEQASQLRIARRAGKELVKVINDILEFARVEAVGTPVPVPRTPALPRRAVAAAAPGGPMTVLIAEDDPTIMAVMTRLASRAGHRVVAAKNGHEAYAAWESERPHLVLMDVKMPSLDGLDATRKIRDREKKTGGEVPIYGLTAHVLPEDIDRCLDAGMTGHLGKPVEFTEVLEILSRHQQLE